MNAKDCTYWIHFRAVRPGDDHCAVASDAGTEATFQTHADAVKFCEQSGESYHDNTD